MPSIHRITAVFQAELAQLISRQQFGLNDALRGWFYAIQRMVAETRLSLMLWEACRGS